MPRCVTKEVWLCDICELAYDTEEEAKLTPVCHCQPDTVEAKKAHCQGCYNDHYNQNHPGTCWSLGSMQVIYRKKVHINDVPPWNHEPRKFPDCYKVPKYVFVGANQTH